MQLTQARKGLFVFGGIRHRGVNLSYSMHVFVSHSHLAHHSLSPVLHLGPVLHHDKVFLSQWKNHWIKLTSSSHLPQEEPQKGSVDPLTHGAQSFGSFLSRFPWKIQVHVFRPLGCEDINAQKSARRRPHVSGPSRTVQGMSTPWVYPMTSGSG